VHVEERRAFAGLVLVQASGIGHARQGTAAPGGLGSEDGEQQWPLSAT
jgi:hypothetical protein